MPVLLQARSLCATLPGDTGPVRVLDDVDLALEAGTLVDVVGPSGSGKTTLLRTLARVMPGASGQLALAGEDAGAITPALWRARVALLPQTTAIRPGTVRANLLLPWTLKVRHSATPPDDEALREALDGIGLTDVALDRDAARLSVGQTARISMLRVVLTKPEVLLLDEPDANLDEASANLVTQMTRTFVEAGGAAIRVRHHRSDALAARRLRLTAGKLEAVELT